MKVSYDWLQTYFDTYLPRADKLAQLFSAHAFEVEGTELVGRDTVFDLKVLPDRAHYALCHRGIAYEASAISRIPLKTEKKKQVEIDSRVITVPVTIENTTLCRRYIARRIEALSVTESPLQIKEKLEAIGARAINSIVDATNFVMFDIGQPLHAFDADKVQGGIVVRLAQQGEKITLLDGREAVLSNSDLIIADTLGPLAIAGVKGGKRAEVTNTTKNIILESANFEPASIRKTATRLNLRNDSSKRFENEITPVLAEEAMEHVTKLILELSKGAKAGNVTDIYSNPVKPWTVQVSRDYISKIIGIDVVKSEFERILSALRFSFKSSGDIYDIHVPFDRLDIKIPEDVADEIGRMIGYEKLPSKQTPEIARVPIDKTFYYAEKVKNILVGLGFSEVQTYSLVPKGHFEIAYPLASDKSALREGLLNQFVDLIMRNLINSPLVGLNDVYVFEIGKVFPKTGEKTMLCVGGTPYSGKLTDKKRLSEVFVKNALLNIKTSLGVEFEPIVKSESWGTIAEIDFDSLISKLPDPTSITDLNFKPLSRDIRYKPFSQYPFIVRDIAFFAPKDVDETKARTVLEHVARASSGDLLIKGPDIFDKFPKGEKVSYAFRMIFQSFNRTLSDNEVGLIMEKIYGAVKGEGWEIR